MAGATKPEDDPKAFYGYLFGPDKGPTELMKELLTGIGKYIISSIGDPSTTELTPPKLAAYYRAVGGNYDPVFLDPPPDRISFIYTSLGCQHTLQPGDNDYEPPSIPALTLKGFVRWQNIETLLGPEEHVPYLQYTLANFEILRADGITRFPRTLPSECLPSEADDQLMRWHEDCSKRLGKVRKEFSPRRRSSSVENNYDSPKGSRASSIASARGSGRSRGQPSKLNTATDVNETADAVIEVLTDNIELNERLAKLPRFASTKKETAIDNQTESDRPSRTRSRMMDEMSSIRSVVLPAEGELHWKTNVLARPQWEPPILDYRKYDEGGDMYDSLHRHPETKPEKWYEYTDAEIEKELLGDYSDWLFEARKESSKAGNEEQEKFYDTLSHELDIDRVEAEDEFEDVVERMYVARQQERSGSVLGRTRVQQQFDEVRKVWRAVESVHSDWDEGEWEIFGRRGRQLRRSASQLSVTESNLQRLQAMHISKSDSMKHSESGESRGHSSVQVVHSMEHDIRKAKDAGELPSQNGDIESVEAEKHLAEQIIGEAAAVTLFPRRWRYLSCCFG